MWLSVCVFSAAVLRGVVKDGFSLQLSRGVWSKVGVLCSCPEGCGQGWVLSAVVQRGVVKGGCSLQLSTGVWSRASVLCSCPQGCGQGRVFSAAVQNYVGVW